jgi:hypothetical protein
LVEVVGDGPALGGDFQDFADGVCQVEEDFGWCEGIAFEAYAMIDLLGGRVAVGAGFQGAENGAESERGGGRFEFGIVPGGDPVTEIGGAEREDAAGIHVGGDAGAGLAALGEEGRGGAGVVEEGERLIGLAETLGHACWFEGSGKMARDERSIREIVEGVEEKLGVGWSLGVCVQRQRCYKWHGCRLKFRDQPGIKYLPP